MPLMIPASLHGYAVRSVLHRLVHAYVGNVRFWHKADVTGSITVFSCILGQRSVMYQTAIYRILAAGNIGCIIGQEK
ncbi:hypothetical protein D1629_19740 (plasmid) [Pantoea agglomerans]|nr:hypothetical protein D1629_19740 [Pantoea agglomerans]QAV51466.1 hypothetical protein D1628_19370 [Pantoea agglomerans]